MFTALLWLYSALSLLSHMRTNHRGIVSSNRGWIGAWAAAIAMLQTLAMLWVLDRAKQLVTQRGGVDADGSAARLVLEMNQVVGAVALTVATGLLISSALWFVLTYALSSQRPLIDYQNTVLTMERQVRIVAFGILFFITITVWVADLGLALPIFGELGAFHVLILSSIALLIILAGLHNAGNRYGVPVTLLLIILIMFSNVLDWNRPPVTASRATNTNDFRIDGAKVYRDELLQKLLTERLARHANRPIIPLAIVALQGGGMVAASHGAKSLVKMAERAPCFADDLVAFSSVSGGALGTVAYLRALELARSQAPTRPHSKSLDPCSTNSQTWEKVGTDVNEFFKRDLLTPVVRHLFGVDLLREVGAVALLSQFGWNLNSRAEALVHSLQSELDASQLRRTEINPLFGPFVFMNATSSTGRRVYSGPFSLEAKFVAGEPDAKAERRAMQQTLRDLSPEAAAIVSARFPFVLPGALIDRGVGPRAGDRIMDGGYFDNSGLLTAEDVRQVLAHAVSRHPNKDRFRIIVLATTSIVPVPTLARTSGWWNEWISPILQLNTVRVARGQEVVADYAFRAQNPVSGICFVQLPLQANPNFLPLGFAMSEQARQIVERSVATIATMKFPSCAQPLLSVH
jgi:hypothetical protein